MPPIPHSKDIAVRTADAHVADTQMTSLSVRSDAVAPYSPAYTLGIWLILIGIFISFSVCGAFYFGKKWGEELAVSQRGRSITRRPGRGGKRDTVRAWLWKIVFPKDEREPLCGISSSRIPSRQPETPAIEHETWHRSGRQSIEGSPMPEQSSMGPEDRTLHPPKSIGYKGWPHGERHRLEDQTMPKRGDTALRRALSGLAGNDSDDDGRRQPGGRVQRERRKWEKREEQKPPRRKPVFQLDDEDQDDIALETNSLAPTDSTREVKSPSPHKSSSRDESTTHHTSTLHRSVTLRKSLTTRRSSTRRKSHTRDNSSQHGSLDGSERKGDDESEIGGAGEDKNIREILGSAKEGAKVTGW